MIHGLEWLPDHLVFESGSISCKQKGSSTKVCLAFCMGSCKFRQACGYHTKKILPQTIYLSRATIFWAIDLMLKLRKQFLVLLLSMPLMLHLNACAPESTQGTIPDPEYGKGSITVLFLELNEEGKFQEITIVLDNVPQEDVAVIATCEIAYSKSCYEDKTEAQFVVNSQFQSSAELIFTPINWDIPQILKIQGQYDEVIDGDQPIEVKLEVSSDDPIYSNPDISTCNSYCNIVGLAGGLTDLTFRNFDNTPSDGIASFKTEGTVTELSPNEPGFEQAVFPIQLTSRPSSNVEVSIDFAPDTPEIANALLSISPPSKLLTFTPENWQTPQSFIITAKQEDIDYSSNENFTLNIESTGQYPFNNKFWPVTINREDNDVQPFRCLNELVNSIKLCLVLD